MKKIAHNFPSSAIRTIANSEQLGPKGNFSVEKKDFLASVQKCHLIQIDRGPFLFYFPSFYAFPENDIQPEKKNHREQSKWFQINSILAQVAKIFGIPLLAKLEQLQK